MASSFAHSDSHTPRPCRPAPSCTRSLSFSPSLVHLRCVQSISLSLVASYYLSFALLPRGLFPDTSLSFQKLMLFSRSMADRANPSDVRSSVLRQSFGRSVESILPSRNMYFSGVRNCLGRSFPSSHLPPLTRSFTFSLLAFSFRSFFFFFYRGIHACVILSLFCSWSEGWLIIDQPISYAEWNEIEIKWLRYILVGKVISASLGWYAAELAIK